MSIPTPNHQIGDIVWLGTAEGTTEQLPCPDCLGTKKWKVTTPAGTEMETDCIRCGRGHSYIRTQSHEEIPSLSVRKFVPCTRRLTIGSVRINTSDERPVSYMCRETGVGSGSVYYEHDLHPTEEAAYTAATMEAALRTDAVAQEPQQIVARKLGALVVSLAGQQADWNAVYNAWDVARWHCETLESICGEEDKHLYSSMDEMREYAQQRQSELRRYSFINRHPFEALLVAARASSDPTVREIVENIDDKLPSGDDATKADAEEMLSTAESTELRLRAENLHLFAGSYELHAINPSNSPAATAAYEAALSHLTDAYLALIGAADTLDERAGFRLPFSVRAVEIEAPVRVVAVGIERVMR